MLVYIILIIAISSLVYLSINKEHFKQDNKNLRKEGIFYNYKPFILPYCYMKKYKYVYMDQHGRIHRLDNEINKKKMDNCECIECPNPFPKTNKCFQCPKYYKSIL